MSSLKARVIFSVNHEITTLVPAHKVRKQFMKSSSVNDMVPVYKQSNITVKFGVNAELEMKPLTHISKELTSLGYGSRASQGRSIRIAMNEMVKSSNIDKNNSVYGIYAKDGHMFIAILDHSIDPACKHNEVHLMNSIILEIETGNRLTITKHYSNVKQKHNPYFKGMRKDMKHVVSADRKETRGKYVREAKTIEITEENVVNESEFTIKLADIVNENSDVVNELIEENQILKATVKMMANHMGIQLPAFFNDIADPSEFEDEIQSQEQFELVQAIDAARPVRYK